MKCSICGSQFTPRKEAHYVSRETGSIPGLAGALTGGKEDQWYDSFDCPTCGCQILAQRRNRMVIGPDREEEDDNG